MNKTDNNSKKLILRYAVIIAKGETATTEEKGKLTDIENDLRLTREAILREATKFGLGQIR